MESDLIEQPAMDTGKPPEQISPWNKKISWMIGFYVRFTRKRVQRKAKYQKNGRSVEFKHELAANDNDLDDFISDGLFAQNSNSAPSQNFDNVPV
ncbi:hypothetical protein RHMOL_Rhmol13G0289300 [Rhododendron molle]|uniref:Uncharacterized protein n=1 Tax=Rhododendron molle TaxID=49168 RepID=A0ACC0LCD4_RHOML|nr:hypothetical protein RHMOL_Rhmol13G0289300 [Rhododendron molle]